MIVARQESITASGITVRFGDVVALEEVNLDLPQGGIHALLGQNGAGKTTLARVIAGLIRPDAGQVDVFGQRLTLGDPKASARRGIEMVHQNFTLAPNMTVAEAMEATSSRWSPAGVFGKRSLHKHWDRILADHGLPIDSSLVVRHLPIEQLQAVEIARSMNAGAQVLILDEPTAVLAPPAVASLFGQVRRLAVTGVTVILVLHKLNEVLEIADTVTVLRAGRVVLHSAPRDAVSPVMLADLMIGQATSAEGAVSKTPSAELRRIDVRHPPALELIDVSSPTGTNEVGLRNVALRVSRGEIVGVAGVVGNGQRSVVAVAAGLTPATVGRVVLGGVDVTRESLAHRKSRGLRIIPFDRSSEGISTSTDLWRNYAVGHRVTMGPISYFSPKSERARARKAFDKWDVRYARIDQLAGSLSGGNIQKLILAREVDSATVIVAANPTRGLDLHAAANVQSILRTQARDGAGIVLVSADLDELMGMSDTIVVINKGELVATFCSPFDIQVIGRAMLGATR